MSRTERGACCSRSRRDGDGDARECAARQVTGDLNTRSTREDDLDRMIDVGLQPRKPQPAVIGQLPSRQEAGMARAVAATRRQQQQGENLQMFCPQQLRTARRRHRQRSINQFTHTQPKLRGYKTPTPSANHH